MDRKQILIFVTVLLAAFLLRLYFIPSPGYERDVQLFKIWGQTAAQNGIHNIYDKTWCDYPPAYIYVLKSISSFYSLFHPDFKEHTYLYDLLIKLPAILSDLLISCLIFFILRKDLSFRSRMIFMSAFAFNPVIIFDSVYWGQIDSVTTLVALLSILALTKKRYYLSWALIALAILIKSQMVILLPITILLTWKRCGFKTLMGGFAAFWASFLFILSPFFYFHKVDQVVNVFVSSVGRYPNVSMNAFNFWWLISKGNGANFWDGQRLLNLFSLKTIGSVFLLAFMVLLLKYLFDKEKDKKAVPTGRQAVFFSCALALFSFFMLPTEMHERYILPVFAFLLLAAADDLPMQISYGVLSATGFFNLAIVLSWAYPNNVPLVGKISQGHFIDISASIVNLAVLAFFIFLISKEAFRKIKIKYLISTFLAIALMLLAFYFFKPARAVYLSDMETKENSQGWGSLQIDKSVDKNRLSVGGFLYSKGIGTHANSTIKYILDGNYGFLEGSCGLDDEQNRGNKIECLIYADEKMIYDSGIFQGYLNPHYFKVPVKGVKEIKLVVEDGGDGINCDHADWLEVKAIP